MKFKKPGVFILSLIIILTVFLYGCTTLVGKISFITGKSSFFTADFEIYMDIQDFPESYKPYLRELHKENENWIFVANDTELDWNEVISAESEPGVNTVYFTRPVSWKSMDIAVYNNETFSWLPMDSDYFVAASKEIIEYFIDPRNFLNREGLSQFEALDFAETQTTEGLINILDGSFMDSEFYFNIFYNAGKLHDVSPYFLAAKALQELSAGGSNASSGTYEDFEGYYNYFNIGASPNSDGYGAMENGLQRAKNEGWDTVEKAITGGAKFIAERYIAKGQTTMYYHKFDVINDENTGLFCHQYMTNIEGAYQEAKKMVKASSLDASGITFNIPVYNNMPENALSKPL